MTEALTALPVLSFPDKKQSGTFPVLDQAGTAVAYLATKWSGSSFAATSADGTPVCSGRRRGWFSRYWDVLDASGNPIASLRSGWATKKYVELPDGRTLTIAGRWAGRDWTMTDEQGRLFLAADAQGSGFSFHPDNYLVQHDPAIGLAQVVGVVEACRMMIKAARGAAAAASG